MVSTSSRPMSSYRVSPQVWFSSLSGTTTRNDPLSTQSHKSPPVLHPFKSTTTVNECGSDTYNSSFLHWNDRYEEWFLSLGRERSCHYRGYGYSGSKSSDAVEDRMADALTRQRLAEKMTTSANNHDKPAMISDNWVGLMAHMFYRVWMELTFNKARTLTFVLYH
jgi:hypothetical protein